LEPRRYIRSGIAVSALGHLSILAVVLIFAEVHPFGSVTAEPIAVDIVTSEEAAQVPEKPEPPKPDPSDAFDLSSKSAPSEAPAPAPAPQAAPSPETTAPAPSSQRPDRREAVAQPPAPSTSPLPAYVAPEPDLSIKYQVMLGLPPDLSPSLPQATSGDAFDGPASKAADVASSVVTEFRRHLKTCSKLPPSIASSDKVKIVLRVFMTPEAKLAAEPVLIEASASAKGPLLMQGAISALEACQPYAMLPVDRYGEWKVLDLSFTPQDFAGPS
jgi:hypothetical protein